MPSSICYVLPSLDPDAASHLAHLPRLLDEIARKTDLWVIAERGAPPTAAWAGQVLVQGEASKGRWRRYREFSRLVKHVRSAGCRRFFVRISKGTALVLLLLRRSLDLEVFYWNSGSVRSAWPSWSREPFARMKLAAGDQVTRFIVRHADRFITGPPSMIDYYVSSYGVDRARCIALDNDVDVERFVPSDPAERTEQRLAFHIPDEFVILFVGRISRYKGGSVLPRLVDGLDASPIGHRYRLVVAGEHHLLDIAHDLSVRERVELLGPVPNPKLPNLYRSADVFILPSLAEGFPRVVLEAMASGLPVIASNVGGVRDLLRTDGQGILVAPGDVGGLVKGLTELADDPARRRRMGAANREASLRFKPEAVAARFVEDVVEPPVRSTETLPPDGLL